MVITMITMYDSATYNGTYGVRTFWCTGNARARLPCTPRWHSVVANATTDPQLASDELTELAVGGLDVTSRPPAAVLSGCEPARRSSRGYTPAPIFGACLSANGCCC